MCQNKSGSISFRDKIVCATAGNRHRHARDHVTRALDDNASANDELKAQVPIWKKEHYADGHADWKANKP